MTEDRCELTELLRAECAHCRKQDLPKPPPLDWFPARYDGWCALCRKPIEVGDEIASTDDGYICRRRHEDL